MREEYGTRFGGVAGWEYWDAGRDDGDVGMRVGGEPWRWVARIGRSVFGEGNRDENRKGRRIGGERDCWRKCGRVI